MYTCLICQAIVPLCSTFLVVESLPVCELCVQLFMTRSCLQVIAMYLFPLLIGVAVTDNVYGDWTLGYYGHVAELVGGPALAAAVTVAAALSQVGMFEAEMSADSYQVRTNCGRRENE